MKELKTDIMIVTALEDIACKHFSYIKSMKIVKNRLLKYTFLKMISFAAVAGITKGLLNLRGSDFEYAPLFFAYVIIDEHNMSLFLLKKERAETNKVANHFQTEHIDVSIEEYNATLTGINNVVSNFNNEDEKMKREGEREKENI